MDLDASLNFTKASSQCEAGGGHLAVLSQQSVVNFASTLVEGATGMSICSLKHLHNFLWNYILSGAFFPQLYILVLCQCCYSIKFLVTADSMTY